MYGFVCIYVYKSISIYHIFADMRNLDSWIESQLSINALKFREKPFIGLGP